MATAVGLSWKEHRKDLLEILNQLEDSEPFHGPIDDLFIMHYLEFVDEVGNYATPTELAKDVRLVFENSRKYFVTNRKSSSFSDIGITSLVFKEQFRNILLSYKRKTSPQSKSNTDGLVSITF